MRKITKINPAGMDHSLHEPNKLCTAAYARVSTDSTEQLQSFNAQVEHYTNFINSNPEWEFVGVYADENAGIRCYVLPFYRINLGAVAACFCNNSRNTLHFMASGQVLYHCPRGLRLLSARDG